MVLLHAVGESLYSIPDSPLSFSMSHQASSLAAQGWGGVHNMSFLQFLNYSPDFIMSTRQAILFNIDNINLTILAPSVVSDEYVPTLQSSPLGHTDGIHQQRSTD